MLSPPIVPPSQHPAEQQQDSSGSLSAQGGNMKNAMYEKIKIIYYRENQSLWAATAFIKCWSLKFSHSKWYSNLCLVL